MTKPKYCSWDVRDLAADHGWSEQSDERDITNVRLSKNCGGSIYVCVHLQTGFTQVYFEKTDQDRTLISSANCIEFRDLEKVLSETEFFNSGHRQDISLDKSVSKKTVLTSNSESYLHQVEEAVSDEDDFNEIRSLIKSWDDAEKV